MTNPDFSDLFSCFAAAEVRFLVVGGYAVAFHGFPRHTKDLDVWIDNAADNSERARKALIAFGAPMREVTVDDLRNPETVLQIGVAPNRIDVITHLEGLSFDDAWKRRVPFDYGQQKIFVVSKADLIESKRRAGRPRDLEDLKSLEGPGAGS